MDIHLDEEVIYIVVLSVGKITFIRDNGNKRLYLWSSCCTCKYLKIYI